MYKFILLLTTIASTASASSWLNIKGYSNSDMLFLSGIIILAFIFLSNIVKALFPNLKLLDFYQGLFIFGILGYFGNKYKIEIKDFFYSFEFSPIDYSSVESFLYNTLPGVLFVALILGVFIMNLVNLFKR